MPGRLVGAIDLGGTKILAAVVDDDGHPVAERRIATEPERGPDDTADRMVAALDAAAQEAGVARAALVGLGVTVPGPIDPSKQIVGQPPNLTGWKNVPLGAMLRERTHLPIAMVNDANAAALGEQSFGAGRGVRDLIYITVSTGVGGGIISNGKLVGGMHGAAGEIGHMTVLVDGPTCGCGRKGCLEALASGTAIAREAAQLIANGKAESLKQRAGTRPSAAEVEDAADAGDEAALALLDKAADYLGIGLMNLIHLIDPEVIVIGGGVAKSERLVARAAAYARTHAFPVMTDGLQIVPAALGDRSGVLGAASLALRAADA
jgi:glucokinase